MDENIDAELLGTRPNRKRAGGTASMVIYVVKKIVPVLILGFLYLLFFQKFGFGIPCLFYKLTGYQCPGCGMTRAIKAIWEGNYKSAMQYNALSLTVLPGLCVYLFYRFFQQDVKNREGFRSWEYVFLIGLLIVVAGYGYIRNQI